MAEAVTQSLNLKQRLEKNQKPDSQDLYSHVAKVMAHIVNHCPDQSMNKLEEVSYILKDPKINKEDFLKTKIIKGYAQPSDETTKMNTQPTLDGVKKYFGVSLSIIFDFV